MKNITRLRKDSITVIIVTRNRPTLLKRAIASVLMQTYQKVDLLVLVDDSPETLTMLEQEYANNPKIKWLHAKRDEESESGPKRLAFLRNYAISQVVTEYFSFLDDDNEFYPCHLEKLLQFVKSTGCEAVHSYREVLYNNGEPYLEMFSPWGRNLAQRREKYLELVAGGVVTPGSNIWKDKFGVTVDMNVWLFETKLFEKISFPTNYSAKDWDDVIPEDAKLMALMKNKGIVVDTNALPTVKYYLGGYSNSCGNTEGTELWKK